jgi:hypothetical protein
LGDLPVRSIVLALSQSGFLSFASLAFSDTDIVARYFREFALSLVEALPLLAITFALVALAAFLVSLRMLATNVRGGLTLSPL